MAGQTRGDGAIGRLSNRVPTLPPRVRRGITLASAIVVSLSAGTNYVFSAYSPQLAARLHLSSTQTNGIAIAGNLGMYLTGPLAGKLVDSRGPQIPLFISSILLLIGYGIVRQVFVAPVPEDPSRSTPPLGWLIFGMFLTGMGSSGALSAAANGVAKSFGEARRGVALAAVISGFGASAFLWATLSHLLFSENTGDFLLLLSLGTATCVMLGVVGVKPVPPSLGGASTFDGETKKGRTNGYRPVATESSERIYLSPNGQQQDLVESEPASGDTTVVDAGELDGDAEDDDEEDELDIHGLDLLKTREFPVLLVIMACCSGAGLMLINNIGTIIHTLDASHPSTTASALFARSASSVQKLQASQVSLLSIFNCLGRLVAGFLSDFLRNRYSINRGWSLSTVTSLFVVTQIVALTSVDVETEVWRLVVVGGFAYGSLFATAPILVLEWFGTPHFSTSFGFLNLAPVVSGQAFNLAFGRIYDSHIPASLPSEEHSHLCMLGKECYETAFEATLGACVVALGLAVYIGWRRSRIEDPRDAVMRGLIRIRSASSASSVTSPEDAGSSRRHRNPSASKGRTGRSLSRKGRVSGEMERSISFGAEAGLSPFIEYTEAERGLGSRLSETATQEVVDEAESAACTRDRSQ